MMLEYLNTAACLLLMLYSLPVAMMMGNSGMWRERLSVVAVQVGLFLQLTTPWVTWAPSLTWPSVYLNCAAVVMLTIWRRRVWIFLLHYIAPVNEPMNRLRRGGDWPKGNPRPAQRSHQHHRFTDPPNV